MKNSCEIQIYNDEEHKGVRLFIEAETNGSASCNYAEIVFGNTIIEVNCEELHAALCRVAGKAGQG